MPASNLHKVIDQICEILFQSEQRRIQTWIDQLIKQNMEFYPQVKFDGFLHDGVLYRGSWTVKGPIPTKAIHASLWPEMDLLITGKKEIEQDEAFIRQTLFKLLYDCQTDQDVRDALPDCLVSILTFTNPLSRTRPAAYTIEGDQRALKQYQKMLPKIELYTATKLLF
jgi:hypothetical protein